jgi:hypothetical protein
MSWREIEGQTIDTVIPVDQSEVVLKLQNGKLARITARAPADTPENEAKLELTLQKEQG